MLRAQLLKVQLISRPENCVETREKETGHTSQQRFLNCVPSATLRVAVAQLFEAPCNKPQGSISKNAIGIFHWQYFRRPYGPVFDSACNRSEYQGYFLRVKTAGAYGWQPYNFHVPPIQWVPGYFPSVKWSGREFNYQYSSSSMLIINRATLLLPICLYCVDRENVTLLKWHIIIKITLTMHIYCVCV